MKRSERRQLIRSELLALANERGGQLSPRAVLDAAREESSPLHEFFEWDDAKAAEGFRLVQASALIREVKLEVITETKDPTRVSLTVRRAFYSMPSLRGSAEGSYVPAQSITDPAELVREVIAQMDGLRKKHAALTQLSGVWREVDKARETLDEQGSGKKSRKKRAA